MFDRRTASFNQVNCHLFLTQFKDETKTVEIQVNPEFSIEEASTEANLYGEAIGRIPKCLRTKVKTVWIHKGTMEHLWGGGNDNLLIHTACGQNYISKDLIDAAFMHEATHTSLDPVHLHTAHYRDIQKSDNNFVSPYAKENPDREDLAESFAPWFITRYRKD
jgi:hypothetical protein